MNRETKELTTKSGKKFVVLAYLTYNDLEPSFSIADAFKKNAEIMKVALISLEGTTDAAYDRVKQLPFADYSEINAAVAVLINPDFQAAK